MDTSGFEQYSDEEIAELVIKDKAFFGILIRRYEKKLGGYVWKMSGKNKEEIDDMLQNIFIKAYVNINSLKKEHKFSNWLYGIAHNECIDHWRRYKKHSNNISLEANDNLSAVLTSNEDLVRDIIDRGEADEMNMILNKLPYKYKEILVLKYLEDKSYEEIGEILKKPVSTIGTMLRRAKIRLKKYLENKSNELR
ncbi:MAG: RNA polymerase sigma factor [Candidatus Moranbacteria bacterium]|nr:RNA polymerase sigma factor [Candidatus Moranbacteria bacterium]